MTRREMLAAPAAAVQTARAQARRPPNVLLIMTDDQGYGDLSLHGNPVLKTPNLDALGRESVRFEQFQVCPVCSPTRSSLMTGRYNYRTGIVDTFLGRSMMHADEVTMAEYLKKAGYRTGIFGKWHLGDNYPLRAIDQGFEEALVCKGGGVGQPSDPPGNSYFDPVLQHNGKAQKRTGYCTDIFFDETLRFIEANRNRPWFAYLPTNAPHDPLTIGEQYVKPFAGKGLDDATAKTYGMVVNFDDNMGRLLKRLDQLGLRDNTILIYLTDNGPQRDRFNAGMRGRKGTPYQGGIRVPFFLRWPARFRTGTIDRAAAHIDVLPTILEACGVRADGPRQDGRSLMPLLRGETASWQDRTLFTQWHRGDEPVLFRSCAARTQQYKLVNGTELFDLAADPAESRDIAKDQPEVASRLRRETETWFKDVSSTRGYAPPRIHVGTPHESPTVLTRQDWRGAENWGAGSNGHWELEVARAGQYRVAALVNGGAKAETPAALSFGAQEAKATLAAGEGRLEFDPVTLPAGPARIQVKMGTVGKGEGPNYLEVRTA